VSKSILIVESENDKYFIEALIGYLKISDINVGSPICSIDDYECLGGLSRKSLERKLIELETDIGKGVFGKIGIILDADAEGIQKRIELINKTLKVIDENLNLIACNSFVKSEKLDVEIACYIMNVKGFGELETVLKAIKSHDSTYADCLKNWKICLEQENKTIKPKDFDKFWINVYQRYDCCTNRKDKKHKDTRCNFAASMKKDIWNFESDELDELKNFLNLFKTV